MLYLQNRETKQNANCNDAIFETLLFRSDLILQEYDEIPCDYLEEALHLWECFSGLQISRLCKLRNYRLICRQLDIVYQTWERYYVDDDIFYANLVVMERICKCMYHT